MLLQVGGEPTVIYCRWHNNHCICWNLLWIIFKETRLPVTLIQSHWAGEKYVVCHVCKQVCSSVWPESPGWNDSLTMKPSNIHFWAVIQIILSQGVTVPDWLNKLVTYSGIHSNKIRFEFQYHSPHSNALQMTSDFIRFLFFLLIQYMHSDCFWTISDSWVVGRCTPSFMLLLVSWNVHM